MQQNIFLFLFKITCPLNTDSSNPSLLLHPHTLAPISGGENQLQCEPVNRTVKLLISQSRCFHCAHLYVRLVIALLIVSVLTAQDTIAYFFKYYKKQKQEREWFTNKKSHMVDVHWHYLKADTTYKSTILMKVYLLLCSWWN